MTEDHRDRRRVMLGTICRLGAAVAVVVSGSVHVQLYLDGYREFPNPALGRSFVVQVAASFGLAVALLWRSDLVVRVAALVLLFGTLGAFASSRTGRGVFGFVERGLEPSPQAAIALAAAITGVILLAATLVPAIGAGTRVRPAVAVAASALVLLVGALGTSLWARGAAPTTVAPTAPAAAAAPPSTVGPTNPGGPVATAVAPAPAATVPSPTAPAADVVTVSIADFAFREPTIEVALGTTVEWVNDDSFAHSVVADDDSFRSDDLGPGDRFSFTFTTAGTFSYICGIHPSMLGSVTVVG